MRKYNKRSYDRTGIVRMYRNEEEVRIARYTRLESRNKILQSWRDDIRKLSRNAVFHISIEPDINP